MIEVVAKASHLLNIKSSWKADLKFNFTNLLPLLLEEKRNVSILRYYYLCFIANNKNISILQVFISTFWIVIEI